MGKSIKITGHLTADELAFLKVLRNDFDSMKSVQVVTRILAGTYKKRTIENNEIIDYWTLAKHASILENLAKQHGIEKITDYYRQIRNNAENEIAKLSFRDI